MKTQINNLIEFHTAFEMPVLSTPQIPSVSRWELRNKLLIEEANELYAACMIGDIVGAADGLIDSLYILLGTACELGLQNKLEEMFAEVHRSNMSKLDDNGKPVKREDGKVIKSKNYSAPNLKVIIEG